MVWKANFKKDPLYQQEKFSLPEGSILITWPRGMSMDSTALALDWFDLIRRKIVRAVEPEEVHPEQNAMELIPVAAGAHTREEGRGE